VKKTAFLSRNGRIAAGKSASPGIAAPSTTVLDGHVAIRAAIVNHRTQRRDIDALVKAAIAFGDAHRKIRAA